MKIVERIDVICRGNVDQLEIWHRACADTDKAITLIDWPHGSGTFKLNPGTTKNANGVKPIKIPGIVKLQELGWQTERLPKQLAGVKMGNLDAMLESKEGVIGFEWETGNISSIHRAVNKILLAIFNGGLVAGILVVPAEPMRQYLTDRTGNVTELRPYFSLWSAVPIGAGVFRIVVVEHDELDSSVPLIPKGKDGMASR
ncbi:MAG: restriction endonuclease [Oscillatoriales cyanobacterium]|nr:MAG: restriction endonuclease [Oscillatoriales cyanobacterium]